LIHSKGNKYTQASARLNIRTPSSIRVSQTGKQSSDGTDLGMVVLGRLIGTSQYCIFAGPMSMIDQQDGPLAVPFAASHPLATIQERKSWNRSRSDSAPVKQLRMPERQNSQPERESSVPKPAHYSSGRHGLPEYDLRFLTRTNRHTSCRSTRSVG